MKLIEQKQEASRSKKDMLIVISSKQTPSLIRNVAFFVALAAFCTALLGPTGNSQAALNPRPADEATVSTTTDETSVAAKADRYRELIAEIRSQIRLIGEAKTRFYVDGVDASYDWKDQWESAVAKIIPLRKEFENVAIDLYLNNAEDEQAPDSLLDTMLSMRYRLLDSDRTHETIAVLERLIEAKPEYPQLKLDLGRSLIKTSQFARGNKLIDSIPPGVLSELIGADDKLLEQRIELQQMYQQEKEILAAEADSDLPRVEILTTRGPILVELFENEAPSTVANFINLVENDFYTGVIFHRVIAGFLAQTGLVIENEKGFFQKRINYRIYDEVKDGRKHFHGYLSMAKTDEPNSGSTQFFITYQPIAQLNGYHTVFGRVIEGMDNAGSLQPTHIVKEEKDKPPKEVQIETAKPDRILSAKVIRKRNHPYQPNKVNSTVAP